MGLHTWFRNKTSDMPKEHFEKLRKKCIRDIKKAFIYTCSYDEWVADCDEGLKSLEEEYRDIEHDQFYKMWRNMLKRDKRQEYYEKTHGKYVKDLEILQNPNSTRNKILRILAYHDMSFDKDIKNGSYLLKGLGYCDNYRINDGYVTHHNAEEARKWLEEYDNGHNIHIGKRTVSANEAIEITNKFFETYPNGTIHYA